MTRPIRLGMLTPSSNIVLEPLTASMLSGLADVTAHFGRFKVTEIALSREAVQQFEPSEILRACELLSHAKVDVIAWNGTSASWLGFDTDEHLCARITAETAIKASTCVLAYRDIFLKQSITRIGLVSPYTDDVQERIIDNWARSGVRCVSERHAGIKDNFSFGELSEAQIADMIRQVATTPCDAIVVLCTNMRGAPLAEPLERELGVPIYDSVAVTLWKSLCAAGVDPGRVKGWGSLFAIDAR